MCEVHLMRWQWSEEGRRFLVVVIPFHARGRRGRRGTRGCGFLAGYYTGSGVLSALQKGLRRPPSVQFDFVAPDVDDMDLLASL